MRLGPSLPLCLSVVFLMQAPIEDVKGHAVGGRTPPYPKVGTGYNKFWQGHTHQSLKKDFEHFVESEGGIPDPAVNLPPKGFASFKPFKKGPYKPFFSSYKESHKYRSPGGGHNAEGEILNLVKTRRGKLAPKFHHPASEKPHGCEDSRGFHFEGETWYSRGCRRHKCLHFGGSYFVETDSCDTEIHNTTYKCVIEVDLDQNYPHCCPRYKCNPDNLGNRVNVT